jgi:hypothetical protein
MTARNEYLKNVQRIRQMRINQAAAFRDGTAQTASDEKPTPRYRPLSAMQADYLDSNTGRAHGKYLDGLILKRTAETPTPPTVTGGDLHRAALLVGAQPRRPHSHEDTLGQRRSESEIISAAVAAIYDDLPDLVTTTDVIARLPRDVVAIGNANALAQRIGRGIRAAGATQRDAGNPNAAGMFGLYIIRDADRYLAMTRAKLAAIYAATPGSRRAAEHRKASVNESRGSQPAACAENSGPVKGQMPGDGMASQ